MRFLLYAAWLIALAPQAAPAHGGHDREAAPATAALALAATSQWTPVIYGFAVGSANWQSRTQMVPEFAGGATAPADARQVNPATQCVDVPFGIERHQEARRRLAETEQACGAVMKRQGRRHDAVTAPS